LCDTTIREFAGNRTRRGGERIVFAAHLSTEQSFVYRTSAMSGVRRLVNGRIAKARQFTLPSGKSLQFIA
jgi:hypothetical protein